jgi:hypothetical protein
MAPLLEDPHPVNCNVLQRAAGNRAVACATVIQWPHSCDR